MTESPLQGRTLIMSGGSRGIGLGVAVAAAKLGANIGLMAKTDEPHPKLPGTIHTAAEEIREAGGEVFTHVGDVRNEGSVAEMIEGVVERFGGIDIVVNNASALTLKGSLEVTPKQYDLMQDINSRGTWMLTTTAIPHLLESPDPRVVTFSPPLNFSRHWLAQFPAYTLSKYGMTILTLGFGAEFADRGLTATCLWPETLIATAAVANVVGGYDESRSVDIMSDAAMILLTSPRQKYNVQTVLDVDLLESEGITDFARYGGGDNPELGLFLDGPVRSSIPA
ncbi:SDR family oxidoreductase [Herbiconiux sp. P16]|uniref:SDR family oxidoreductase n=1 Tax=Herbiconiux wuyangfengii TaxID=3342794 RepID=UPI0035B9D8B3